MTVLRCSGPPPRGYLTCNDPRCSFMDPSEEPHAHDSPEIRAWLELLPRLRRHAGADKRPGFYYVSAIDDGGRRAFVRGPRPSGSVRLHHVGPRARCYARLHRGEPLAELLRAVSHA